MIYDRELLVIDDTSLPNTPIDYFRERWSQECASQFTQQIEQINYITLCPLLVFYHGAQGLKMIIFPG